jgi:phosphatidate cytidylyltransferase
MILMLGGVFFHPILFAVVFGTFLYFTLLEFYKLVEKAGSRPRKNTGLFLGVLFFLVCFGMVYNVLPVKSYLIFIPALTFIFLFEAFSLRSGILQNSAITFTGFVYVAVPFSLLNFIVHPGYPNYPVFNSNVLIGVFLTVWFYDSMAYVAGSRYGKHKLNKKISPNKSWEGCIGGTAGALLMGILNSYMFIQLTLPEWLATSVLVVVFGTLGDLFESIIKRRLNVKDSGTMLPGHGGLLDRFDSLLFVIPVIYVWLSLSGNL